MNCVLVFLRAPVVGQVKSRLAHGVGAERACAIYRWMVARVLEQLQPSRQHYRIIGYWDGPKEELPADWHALVDDWYRQPMGDLTDRLQAGFAWASTFADKVIAIGTDCVLVDSVLLDAAFSQLDSGKAVIGPADDGGYYLIGLADKLADVFTQIRWSSEHTLADQVSRLHHVGQTVIQLHPLSILIRWTIGKPFKHQSKEGECLPRYRFDCGLTR